MILRYIYKILCGCILSVWVMGLTGCWHGDSWPDLEEYIAELNQHPVTTPATPKPFPSWIFKANNLRSPFERPGSKAGLDIRNPLIAWPLSVLQFAGTVKSTHGFTAFVMSPDGKVYPVLEGDALGNQNGRVVSIAQDKIVVGGNRSPTGKILSNGTVTLKLKDSE